MRNLIIAFSLALVAAGAAAKDSKISQLPSGTLNGDLYTNDAIGVNYQFPSGWSATMEPKGSALLDPEHPNAPGNQCSKVLLLLDAPGKSEGRFSSLAALIAVDPDCLSGPVFPQTLQEIDKVNKVVDVVIKRFKNSPFFSPYGVKILEYELDGHVVILLNGGMTINAVEGHPAATKAPLVVSTSFSLAKSNGFWIVWAYVADDPSAEQLEKAKPQFASQPPQ